MLITSQRKLTQWQYGRTYLYLAEGDSWFYYPGEKSNILNPYDLLTVLSDHMDIYSFAMFGDTIKNMSKEKNLNYIKNRLSWIIPGNTNRIKGFLLSGGGNDLFNNFDKMVIKSSGNNPQSYINTEALRKFLQETLNYFCKFVEGTVGFFQSPINYYVHTYDYPFASGDGYNSFFTKIKPWIWPVMEKNGIDKELGTEIMKSILDDFHSMLQDLKSKYNFVHIIDLRGTLKDEKQWENEIHGTKESYKLLGNEYYKQLKSLK